MSKREKFVIAQIEEPKKEQPSSASNFVSPYRGTKVKDEHVYPYVSYGNSAKQYDGFKNNNDEELNSIYTDRETLEENRKQRIEDKYSVNRIPSYYRKESSLGISKNNLAELKGEKASNEEILERNRKAYGTNYQDTFNNNYQNNVNNYKKEELKYSSNTNTYDYNTVNMYDRNDKPVSSFNEQNNYNNEVPNYNMNNNYSNTFNNNYQNTNYNNETPNYNNQNNNYFNEQNNYNNDNFNNRNNFNDYTKEEPVRNVETNGPRRRDSISIDLNACKNLKFGSKNIKYAVPPLEILRRNGRITAADGNTVNYQMGVINRTLEEFKVGGKVFTYTKGPTVTQFEVKLDPGVNVNKITTLIRNLQMNLASESIRMEAPIPGKSTIGIEVPNIEKDTVLFGDLVSSEKFLRDGKPLNVILGLSIAGCPIYANIGDMPHCLVAGATGGGKTVCLYSMIASMLYKASPEEVKMILIDPKRNELIYFEDIPHLATPIIDDPKLATASLKWAVEEMERRYDFLKANRKRTIGDYNDWAIANKQKIIPYIVIIIDEFADLMNTASESFETNVQRLTQKARSAGIHLVIATQRPSTDVIRGTIKANIPTRIAFSVQTQVDSMTILDHVGAEKLLGKGDMLYTRGNNDVRIQGSYISESELDAISAFYYEQNMVTNYMFTHDDLRNKVTEEQEGSSDPVDDELFNDVAHFVFRQRKASANQIQGNFEIGFNRANKILNGLADLGIVSKDNIPGKAKEVIINDIDVLNEILNNR